MQQLKKQLKKIFLSLWDKVHLRVAFFVFLYIFAQSFLYSAYLQVPVIFNGKLFVASRETPISKILKLKGIRPFSGDLLDSKGKLIEKGGGQSPRVFINGKEGVFRSVIKRDDVVFFYQGRDLKEKVRWQVEEIPPPTKVLGAGVFLTLEETGSPGKREVALGSRSGQVVGSRIIKPASPVVIRRSLTRPEKAVALTFDDGPNPPFTDQILSILQSQQVPATFFVVGTQVQKYPDLIRKIQASGSVVGNHSFTHTFKGAGSEEVLVQEIDQARNLIFSLTSVEPKWFRPPFGVANGRMAEVAIKKGYRVILWNVDSEDWRAPTPNFIWERVLSTLRPGAIILLHDGGGNRANTVSALPQLIKLIREQGYAFVTLDQLFGS